MTDPEAQALIEALDAWAKLAPGARVEHEPELDTQAEREQQQRYEQWTTLPHVEPGPSHPAM